MENSKIFSSNLDGKGKRHEDENKLQSEFDEMIFDEDGCKITEFDDMMKAMSNGEYVIKGYRKYWIQS